MTVDGASGPWNTWFSAATAACSSATSVPDSMFVRVLSAADNNQITFDPPVWAMFEKKLFWEAHRVMWDEEYWHLENMMNLGEIGRQHGFTLSVLPVKWCATTAAPVRAVAIASRWAVESVGTCGRRAHRQWLNA